ncbi:response regulator transcription factor [Paracoccus sp. (in: a-proteobacteria)]|uniref:response regulator transcription factor n=1 Tax=Paracoccus sp. TaxID=267 RepID=UPI003A898EFC
MTTLRGTIFLVDDDPGIRSSLSRALRVRGFDVEAFGSAADFLAVYDDDSVGCLILDHGMPDMTGLELQKHLTGMGCKIPIIFITGHGGVPESVQAMKAGALDFLEKPFRQSDLLERVETALQLSQGLMQLKQQARATGERLARLTPREREIVDHMLAFPAEISSKEIGRHLDISPRTVDHHRARILEKMGVGSIVEMIDLLRRTGN